MSRKLLITGGAGFVGSWLALLLKESHPEWQITALDNLKRRGSELNLPRLKAAGIEFIHGDIRQKADIEAAGEFDLCIEASAEPSVLAGINSAPDYLIDTNLNGTIHCLNVANKYKADFIFLSTSRIYPIKNIERIKYTEAATRFEIDAQQDQPGISPLGISEKFSLEGPRSLYGTTKLASELIINEYNEFYGLKTVINRCGVLTGPWQMGKVDQGVMVLWIARHFWKKKLGYFGYGGTGKQVRDMLHIHDLFRLVDWQIANIDKVNGDTFNAGGGREISCSLLELTGICEKVTGNTIEFDRVAENRAADIPIYITDNSKVTAATGWKPQISVEQIVTEIHDWLKQNEAALKPILF